MRLILIILICLYSIKSNAQIETNIYFENGSYQVSSKDKEILKELVKRINIDDVFISVLGYADTIGSYTQNRNLAIKRETAVMSILSQYGVPQKQMALSCGNRNIYDQEITNAKNRRVTVRINPLKTYTTKNGYLVLAPENIKLNIKNHLIDLNSEANLYRNKNCQLPKMPIQWLSDVMIETPSDSCNFIIVKFQEIGDTLSVKFPKNKMPKNIDKLKLHWYASTNGYKYFKIPLYSDYIVFYSISMCGYTPMVYLKIIVPQRIRPIKVKLSNKCIKPISGLFEKNTIRAEYPVDIQADFSTLNIDIKTRDSIYKIPLSEFKIISKEISGNEYYTLQLSEDRAEALFSDKKTISKKKRSFWQKIMALFR